MNVVISIHLMPNELNEYNRTITSICENLKLVRNDNISIFTTLNCSSKNINWYKSNRSKKEIIKKYNEINKKIKGIYTKFEIFEGESEFGVNNHRRDTIKRYRLTDYIIFLDTDIVFSNQILQNLFSLLKNNIPRSQWCVITPQIPRMWDSTWDCLVNDKFIDDEFNSYKKINSNQIFYEFKQKQKTLKTNNSYKFAGGWFTTYSTRLLNYIGIPLSFGPYGPDDTYIMYCMHLMKKKNFNVFQYILKNEIITELPLKSNEIRINTSTHSQRHAANKHFSQEINNFLKNLQNKYIL